jgi:hypothetical protein
VVKSGPRPSEGKVVADLITQPAESYPRRSWCALGATVAGHASLNVLFNPFTVGADFDDWPFYMTIGVLVSQPIMFATWAALGPPPIIKRFPMTIAALVMILFSRHVSRWGRLDEGEMLILPSAVFVGALIIITVVRALTRWRIDNFRQPKQT